MDGPLPEKKNIPHELLIQALGTSFYITAPESPSYLNDILAQYKGALASTQNITQNMPEMKDPLRVAILTGFLLCDQFNKLKRQISSEQTNAEQELNRITRNLIDSINNVIEKKDL